MKKWFVAVCVLLAVASCAQDDKKEERKRDVIYGHKYGLSMTMDIFTPAKPNGASVVSVASGGWFSGREMINPDTAAPLVKRGYTVFVVVHGSQPKFTIPEILDDMHRSIRYVRWYARQNKLDPDRIGIMGGSAGGHLSLMMATAGKDGDKNALDPVDKESSRVQAVACFFPPTDFLNYGVQGRTVQKALENELSPFKAPFDFVQYDKTANRFSLVTDEAAKLKILTDISPISHVTPDDPPTLIFQGDKDNLVPLQQAQVMEAKLKSAKVPVKLVLKPGAGHGWSDMGADVVTIVNWFDEHLKTTQGN